MEKEWKRHRLHASSIDSGEQIHHELAHVVELAWGYPSLSKMPDFTTENSMLGVRQVKVQTSSLPCLELRAMKSLEDLFPLIHIRELKFRAKTFSQ
jgi:hypothetical protein